MDLILYNANVHTVDEANPSAQAIGITGWKITAVGSNAAVLDQRNPKTTFIDLQGKTVLPGFNDSHVHLLSYGLSQKTVDLNGCPSIEELIRTTIDYLTQNRVPTGEWVEGRGWDQNRFDEQRMPDRWDLDRISDRHPIMLKRTCGQVSVVNTRALRMMEAGLAGPKLKELGQTADAARDAEGNLTGIFRGNGQELIYAVIPQARVDQIKSGIRLALNDYVKAGLTSVQSDDFELKKCRYTDILQAYEELDREQALPVRVNQMVCLPDKDDLMDLVSRGYCSGRGSEFFRIGPYTLQTDGSLGARTAALSQAYADDRGNRGVLYYGEAEFADLMENAYQSGFQLVADGIGDRGISLALDTFAMLQRKYPREDPRFGIDHCQITTREILDRFQAGRIIGGLEMIFVASDLKMVEDRVGQDRARWSYNWKSFLDRGIPVAIGSDSPVESYHPMLSIQAAVTKQDPDGYPENGWLPEQRLTVAEAIRAYTLGPAYCTYEEKVKGSITPGKLADLVVLGENIFTVEPWAIKDVPVVMTIVNGEIR